MKKILLLGGSGFLGKSLIKKLEKKNSLKVMIHNSNLRTTAKKFTGDITQKKTFSDEIRNDEIIINMTGQISSDISDFIKINLIGGLNLLNSCLEKKVKQIILISSINVYGENLDYPSKETDSLNPQTTYGVVKMLTEQLYQNFSEQFGINVTILRLAGIYGPSKETGFLSQIIKSINNPSISPVAYNNGLQQRDLLYIDDAIIGISSAIDMCSNGFDIINISSGKRYSTKFLVSNIEKIIHSNLQINYSSKTIDEQCIWADSLKAKNLLGFSPKFDIIFGLKSTLNS